MSDGRDATPRVDSVSHVAQDLALHLEHLQTYRGVRYGMGAPNGSALDLNTSDSRTAVVVDATQSPASNDTGGKPAVSPRAKVRDPSPTQTAAKSAASFDASTWTSEQKLLHLHQRVIGDCRRCALCETREHVVFGEGDANARIMFVGEAPGRDEDRTGRPFVGRAGEKLHQWLDATGLRREQVFIANVLKCRPPQNRDPFGPEVATCSRFLRAQIRAVEPQLLVALGRFAASALLGRPVKMNQVRGRLHAYRDPRDRTERAVCVLYHPAYVLRQERNAEDGVFRKSENEIAITDLREALRSVVGSAGPV